MPRVLVLSHYYGPEVGAPQRRLAALVPALRQHAEVTVVTPLPHYPGHRRLAGPRLGRSTGAYGETVLRVPYLGVPTRYPFAKLGDQVLSAAGSLLRAGTSGRPDVVFSTIPTLPVLAAGHAAARRWRVPHVVEMRDAWPDLLLEVDSPVPPRLAPRVVAGVTALQLAAAELHTVTSGFRDRLVERGADPARVHHFPNGIDVAVVPALTPPSPREDPLRVLYLGTHGVSQDLATSVRALAAAAPHVTARFVGGGSEQGALRALVQELRAPVELLDPVPTAQVAEHYAWADVCLVPLQPWRAFDDTVPSKLYEIMALGRPLIACVRGEAADVVRAAGGGQVVAPGDEAALLEALLRQADGRTAVVDPQRTRRWVVEHADLSSQARRQAARILSVAGR